MVVHTLSTEERLRVIQRVGHVLNSSLDMEAVLSRVAHEAKAIFPLDHFVLYLVNPDKKTYTIRALASSDEILDAPHEDIPLEGGTLGWLIEHREAPYVIYKDLDRERPFAEDESVFRRGLRSGIRAPLVIGDDVFGEIAVASSMPDQFTDEMGEFLCELTPAIATAVANAQTYAELEGIKDGFHQETIHLRDQIKEIHSSDELIGSSRAVEDVRELIAQVAPTEATVLVLGETGTGKELVARGIHHMSARRDRVLVKVNCAALQETLLLSELFGYEKGAFTGAVGRKQGRFEIADKGTIFLDEIGEISPEAQVKILRVMQEREFERVGGNQTLKVDVRIIAATNRDLEEEVRRGRFRDDLYFRLNVIPIHTPPLRERKEDIPDLVDYFVRKHGPRMNRRIESVDPRAFERLMRYDWPGNIRELENVVERALVLGRGRVLRFDRQLLGEAPPSARESEFTSLDEYERRYILRVLEHAGGRVSGERGAARILGMKPTTLQSRMKKLGIEPRREFRAANGKAE